MLSIIAKNLAEDLARMHGLSSCTEAGERTAVSSLFYDVNMQAALTSLARQIEELKRERDYLRDEATHQSQQPISSLSFIQSNH